MKAWKKLFSLFALASALAGTTISAEADDGIMNGSAVLVEETEPGGYEAEAEVEQKETKKASRSAEYQVTDEIKAVLENGELTIQGSGAIPDYTQDNPPWSQDTVTKVIIGDGITEIGEVAFYQKYQITELVIADSVTRIGRGAFAGCSALSQVQWGEGVESVEEYAFQNAIFTQVSLPASLKTLDSLAFFNCNDLENVDVAEENPSYVSVNGIVFSKDQAILAFCPANWQGSSYQIPQGVTEIADYAFGKVKNIKEIQIPDSVKKMGDWVFYESSLEKAVIPDSVTSIGYGPFDGCTSLKEATVGGGISELPYRCFYQCSALQRVYLSDGIKAIGNLNFSYCESLTEVRLPEGLESIGGSAFYGCTSLTELVIPDSVEEIQGSAFQNCPNLTVTVPGRLKKQSDGSYIVAGTLYLEGIQNYDKAFEILERVNAERAAEGVEPLAMDVTLLDAAMTRAVETAVDFSHTRPNGLSCFTITGKASGENIAAGSSTAEGTMNQWMNSPGHRSNILSSAYKSIGVGCYQQNGIWYWVQLFGRQEAQTTDRGGEGRGISAVEIKAGQYTVNCRVEDSALEVGESTTIQAYIVNPGWTWAVSYLHPSSLNFVSRDPSVAEVASDGTITAKASGEATIVCSIKDLEEMSAAVKITVTGKTNQNVEDGQQKPSENVQTPVQDEGANVTQNEGKGVKITLKKPVLKSVKAKKRKAVLKWKQQKEVSGYEIYMSKKKKSGYKRVGTVKKAKKVQFTVKKLKKGKTYYFKIRSFKKVNKTKVYSKYSNIKRVRVK